MLKISTYSHQVILKIYSKPSKWRVTNYDNFHVRSTMEPQLKAPHSL